MTAGETAGALLRLRPPPLWERPELLYIKFTSKDQTVILAMVLKAKSDFLRFYDFHKILHASLYALRRTGVHRGPLIRNVLLRNPGPRFRQGKFR